MNIDLSGRIAVVFGAGCVAESIEMGWGNGQAAAVAYARAGAQVVCVDIHLRRAELTADLIRDEGGVALPLHADVASSGDIEAVVDRIVDEFGTVHIVHNNAAISPFGDPVTLSEAEWDRTFEVNVKSCFLSCKFILPLMRAQNHGVITNISSILSTRVSQYDVLSYYASKAAVDQFSRAVAVANAPFGIRCNSVQPGLINTPLIHAHDDVLDVHGSLKETVLERDAISPTGKQGTAWDIANVSVFLASDQSAYLNGAVVPVDGGLLAKQAAQVHPPI